MPENCWTSSDHVHEYLGRADSLPHRAEGEAVLLEFLPAEATRILDLGTGDGRLLSLAKRRYPQAQCIGLDFSPAMLERARQRFAGDASTRILPHDLDHPLPDLAKVDLVISSFAIHHLVHERKRALYGELFGMLKSQRCVLQSGACLLADQSFARGIPLLPGYNAGNRGPLQQIAGRGNATRLAQGNRVCGCRLPVEMARIGSSGRPRRMNYGWVAASGAGGCGGIPCACTMAQCHSWSASSFPPMSW